MNTEKDRLLTGQAVIIAAGESKRFWPLSTKHKNKAQVSLLGKSLIYWTIKGLAENGIKDIIVVRNPHSSLQEMLDQENDLGVQISYVVQGEQLGTGNALAQAKALIKEPFLVLWPNKINSQDIIQKILSQQTARGGTVPPQIVLVGAETSTPQDYAMIRVDGEKVIELVEKPERGREPSNMKAIGAYLLQPDFFSYYEKLEKHHEADFIDALNAYIKDKKASLVTLTEDVPTLKYPWELFGVLDILFNSENFKEEVASTAQIGKNVVMEGPVYVGENTLIKANTVIEGPVYIGDNCKIGYSNVLRGPLNIESGFISGGFMEIKHSIIQKDNHFHSGFFGDSIVGEGSRFGAGFITANRRLDRGNIKVKVHPHTKQGPVPLNGTNGNEVSPRSGVGVNDEKMDTGLTCFGTVIGDNSKLGIHTGTMPGTFIGSDCVVGPGTMVMQHLENGTTFYTKFENEAKRND